MINGTNLFKASIFPCDILFYSIVICLLKHVSNLNDMFPVTVIQNYSPSLPVLGKKKIDFTKFSIIYYFDSIHCIKILGLCSLFQPAVYEFMDYLFEGCTCQIAYLLGVVTNYCLSFLFTFSYIITNNLGLAIHQ